MAEETPTAATAEADPNASAAKPAEGAADVEKQAFLDRLNKESAKRKDAEKRAGDIEKQLAELRSQMEERETAGLPELERERKRAEQLEKRVAEAEKRAAETERNLQRSQRERWVAQAAAAQNFIDADDAARYVDLDDIEDADAAERAVKRVAKAKQHLIKSEDPALPGRVLENGRTTTTARKPAGGSIDLDAEAQMVSDELKKFLKNRG